MDWLAFGLAAFLSLIVYWFSLPPDLVFGDSGIYATTALYPGPSAPPGDPVWVLYGWLFIKLIPFSDVAWRLALASAFAGAVTCGLIALLVSRTGILAFANSPGFKNMTSREQKAAGLVSGTVAGLGFGLASAFWSKAVVPDPYTLGLLLFTVTVCLLTRWFFVPARKLPFVLAFFSGSLAMVENEYLCRMVLGLWLLVVLAERNFSRDVFLCAAIFLCWIIWRSFRGYDPLTSNMATGTGLFIFIAAMVSIVMGSVFWWKTGKAFSEWKALLLAGLMFLAGQCARFLLPVFSMTVPPVDWGHPRTVEGFFHMTSRSSYCVPELVLDPRELAARMGIYLLRAGEDYGFIYLFAGGIAVLCWWKTASTSRRWLAGLLLAWFFPVLQMQMRMSSWSFEPGMGNHSSCCTVTYLTLALFSGLGLMGMVAHCARPASDWATGPATKPETGPNPS